MPARYNIRTMKTYISLGVFFTTFLFATPYYSEAFTPTNITATRLTNTTAMYTISFQFTPTYHDYYVPAYSVRTEDRSSNSQIGYQFLVDKEVATTAGEQATLLFSDSPLVNGSYKVPQYKTGKFTLVAFLRTNKNTPEADYALNITSLPFTQTNQNTGTQHNKLTPSELRRFITDEIELNN